MLTTQSHDHVLGAVHIGHTRYELKKCCMHQEGQLAMLTY